MTEKELEIQELKAEIKELRTKLGQYQEGLNWTRDRLVCAKMCDCVKSDNELTQYNCFKWRREK